jgi:branched-subunit amino acid ABC-type transport system permease component
MQLLINALIAGSLAALVAGGLALVYGILGVFNLALGQMALIAGYVAWWLHQVAGLPLVASVLGGLAVGALLSAATFEVFVGPFSKRHRFLPLVTTIALSMILDGLILLFFEERPRAILPGVKEQFMFLGARMSWVQASLAVLTVVQLCAMAFVLHSTRLGRRIRAVVQHDHAALGLGIPAPFLRRLVFVLSGVLAGLGGIYIGIDQNLTPVFAFPITVKAYAAVIAGGKGNVWGAVFCAYLIALLEQLIVGVRWFGAFHVPAGYQQTVALLFIIVFLLFLPDGLFSSKQRAA